MWERDCVDANRGADALKRAHAYSANRSHTAARKLGGGWDLRDKGCGSTERRFKVTTPRPNHRSNLEFRPDQDALVPRREPINR